MVVTFYTSASPSLLTCGTLLLTMSVTTGDLKNKKRSSGRKPSISVAIDVIPQKKRSSGRKPWTPQVVCLKLLVDKRSDLQKDKKHFT